MCSQTSYLSPISPIIYVEKKFPCGEFSAFHVWRLQGNKKILYMWRNFRCLPMTDVEKSEILHIWHVCDVENVAIYAKFMLFSWKNQFCQNLRTLSRNPFCRNLRTFVWRKIYPKKFYVEKKWQIWGLVMCLCFWELCSKVCEASQSRAYTHKCFRKYFFRVLKNFFLIVFQNALCVCVFENLVPKCVKHHRVESDNQR